MIQNNMNSPQFPDTPIKVDAKMTNGHLEPQTVTWDKNQYTVVTIGRQWTDKDGTHILIEVHDGSRMEIKLDHTLNWRLQRYWPTITTV